MRTVLYILIIWILPATAWAQYTSPVAVTYENSNKSYYILDKGAQCVFRLDTLFNATKIITGLYQPQDILFGDLGTTRVILVLDSMQIKVFDLLTASPILSVPVPNAADLRSGVVDALNSGTFYLSDGAKGNIIKGVVGPPPFYQVSFSVLASGIQKPSGLLFDRSNRLLVVCDTADSPILQVNTSTGKIDTLKKTNLDYMHSIRQDAQGNYYTTNHGDSYLYRFAPDFSDSVKQIGYNKPAGMYINATQDLMVLACSGCGKIYFNLLHNIAPLPGNGNCPGDSFFIQINPAYKGIGTYNPTNTFVIELSDSLGSFASPIFIRTVNGKELPQSIPAKLPQRKYGKGHLLRIRSNSPAYVSSIASFSALSIPDAFAYGSDTVFACPNQKIQLGSAYKPGQQYLWSGPEKLNDSTVSAPIFESANGGVFLYSLKVENTTQCKNFDTVVVKVANELKINGMPDTLKICNGDTVSLGQSGLPYDFVWTVSGYSFPNESMIRFSPSNSLKVHAYFSDVSVGCFGADSTEIVLFDLPASTLFQDKAGCAGKSLSINSVFQSGFGIKWMQNQNLLSENYLWNWMSDTGEFRVLVTLYNAKLPQCSIKDSFNISIKSNPVKPTIIKIDNVLSSSVTGAAYQWYKNGTEVNGSNQKQISISAADNGFYQVRVYNMENCSAISDSLGTNVGLPIPEMANLVIYPVPAQNRLYVKYPSDILPGTIEITAADGRVMFNGLIDEQGLDVSTYTPGCYYLKVQHMDNRSSYFRWFKN